MKKQEAENEFINYINKIGIKTYEKGNCYWFFNLENGEQRFWTNLSDASLKRIQEQTKGE